MALQTNSPPAGTPWRTLPAAALAASAAAGIVGLGEAFLTQGSPLARYAAWSARLVGLAGAAYAAVGLLLGVAAAALAVGVARRRGLGAERAVFAAGAGSLVGFAAFVASSQVGNTLLPLAVLVPTGLALAVSAPAGLGRAGTWTGLAALALAAGVARAALRGELAVAGLAAALLAAALGVAALARPRLGVPAGLAGLAAGALGVAALWNAFPEPSPSSPADRPSVLLVTIDTLRADRVGCYGYGRDTTPVLDALAAEGVLFENALTSANTTAPSHATMLSGLHPVEHGTTNNGMPLDPQVTVLPDVLVREGYETAAFVSGFTLVDEACGLAGRFDRYGDNLLAFPWLPEAALELRLGKSLSRVALRRGVEIWRGDRPAEETVGEALAWLDRRAERDTAAPFFLWVHCYDPHVPYEPPPPYDTRFDPDYDGDASGDWYHVGTEERRAIAASEADRRHLEALYDGEIAYTDAWLGRLLEGLERHGLAGETLVIVTSDHGEGLGEHGYFYDHGTYLYDTEMRVPLVLRFPDGRAAGTRVAADARLLDLTPTVLDALGIQARAGFSGASLLPLLEPGHAPEPRPVLALSYVAGELSGYPLDGRKLAVRAEGWKLIETSEVWLDTTRVPAVEELYDLAADPGERADLLAAPGDAAAAPPAAVLERLRASLEQLREIARAREEARELTPEMAEKLRGLGYL